MKNLGLHLVEPPDLEEEEEEEEGPLLAQPLRAAAAEGRSSPCAFIPLRAWSPQHPWVLALGLGVTQIWVLF